MLWHFSTNQYVVEQYSYDNEDIGNNKMAAGEYCSSVSTNMPSKFVSLVVATIVASKAHPRVENAFKSF